VSDLLDRRQRVAAAALIIAVDFPVPMHEHGELLKLAGKVAPRNMGAQEAGIGKGRRAGLELARGLIDEMLAEMPAKESE
jgi:hypothetical protein